MKSGLRGLGLAVALAGTSVAASAQTIGTFRWQLQPFCNVVAVNVIQHGAIYTVDGFDDQCGSSQVAPLVGAVALNPDGTIGFGLNIVSAPNGVGVQVSARVSLASLGGPWSDSAGNSGTFVFNGTAAGPPRPPSAGVVIPPLSVTSAHLAPGAVGAVHIAAGSVGAQHLAPGAVLAGLAPGSITAAHIAPGAVGAQQLAPNTVANAVAALGACPPGQYLRGVTSRGGLLCEPIGSAPTATIADRLSGDDVGSGARVAIGSDGLPVIAHRGGGRLRVTRCSNATCTAATTTSPDADGAYVDIAIGADGFPIIAHQTSTLDLRVTYCGDLGCSTARAVSTTLDSVGEVGFEPSIAIGADGLAIVAHWDRTNRRLRVTHCSNVPCTGSSTVVVDAGVDPGLDLAIAIGGDGLPVVPHRGPSGLRLTRCADVVCASSSTVAIEAGGTAPAVAIGGNGLPLIAHRSGSDIRLASCLNATCSSVRSAVVTTLSGQTTNIALAVGSDGFPLVGVSSEIKPSTVVHCEDAACAATTSTAFSTGSGSSLAVGRDGLPVVTYVAYENPFYVLGVAKCNSRTCQ